MNVAIFGGGIAGLTTAISLRAQGHQCRVYEKSLQAQDGGMGFILVPEAITRLESLGIHLRGTLAGVGLDGYSCRDTSGEIVCEQAMPQGSRGIRRAQLTQALIEFLGDAVVCAELRELEFDRELKVKVARLQSPSGSIEVRADLYVSAEGVRSRGRQAIFPDWPVLSDRVPEFVGLVHCDKAARWTNHRLNKFHAIEGGIALGILPVDGEHVVWYLQFDSARHPLPQAVEAEEKFCAQARHEFVRGLVGGWAHPVPSLLAATDFARVHLWRPIDTDLVAHFHRRNLVLVGDAAHPFSPFTSQGVASAIADAVVLARELDGASCSAAIESGLERYSRLRHGDCAAYLANGRRLSANFLEPLSASNAVLPVALNAAAGRAAGSGV